MYEILSTTSVKHALFVLILISAVPLFVHAQTCSGALNPFAQNAGRQDRVRWLEDSFASGASSFTPAEKLAHKILEGPEEDQKLWLSAIAEAYPIVAKGRPGPPSSQFLVGGKRILDRVLFWIQKYDTRFKTFSLTLGPKAAFARILKEETQRFKTKCTDEDIFRVAQNFQQLLRQWSMNNAGRPSRTVIIGGSFINGKWRSGSDVDISFSDNSMAKDMMDEFEAAVHAGVSKDCNPTAQAHIHGTSLYGKLNAFVLEVNANFYQLDVYHPIGLDSPNTPGTSRFESYTWDGDEPIEAP